MQHFGNKTIVNNKQNEKKKVKWNKNKNKKKKKKNKIWATIRSPQWNSHCLSADAMQHSSSIATATRT